MLVPVLTPGRKRRRRRWPYLLLVLLAVALAAGTWRAWPRSSGTGAFLRGEKGSASTPRPHPAKPHARSSRFAAGPLVGANVFRHRFRPPLGARAAILVDSASGRVLWEKKSHRRLAVASLTKIMTAVVALESLRPGAVITVARGVPRVEDFREGLRVGERVPAWKLFYALLLFSGNDDARALAFASAGSERSFVRRMNEEARELGLRDTHFSNSSGAVDRGNYSTPSDLAALTRVALRNRFFRAVVHTRRKQVRWAPPTFSKIYVNKNRLLTTYRGADGVKTGWTTQARHCIVASAHRHRAHLIAVVLGSGDAHRDATRLLDYGFIPR